MFYFQLDEVLKERKSEIKEEQQKDLDKMKKDHEKNVEKVKEEYEEKLEKEQEKMKVNQFKDCVIFFRKVNSNSSIIISYFKVK